MNRRGDNAFTNISHGEIYEFQVHRDHNILEDLLMKQRNLNFILLNVLLK